MHGNYSVLPVNMCVCVFLCVCVLVYIRFVNALVIYFIDSSPFFANHKSVYGKSVHSIGY